MDLNAAINALSIGAADSSLSSTVGETADIDWQWQYFLSMRRVGSTTTFLSMSLDGVDAPSRSHVMTFACGNPETNEHWWAPPLEKGIHINGSFATLDYEHNK